MANNIPNTNLEAEIPNKQISGIARPAGRHYSALIRSLCGGGFELTPIRTGRAKKH
jgi:hypothetical protein